MSQRGFWTLDDLRRAKQLVHAIAKAGELRGTMRDNALQRAISDAMDILATVRANQPKDLELPI